MPAAQFTSKLLFLTSHLKITYFRVAHSRILRTFVSLTKKSRFIGLFMPAKVTVFFSVMHLKYLIDNDSSHIMNLTGICRLLETWIAGL